MTDSAREILQVRLEDEMKQSYLDYAMSVIVGRALPDVRDGLKPVHRRVLYAMRVLANDYNKPYKKSARVVGDVIGKYHPHGDSAVYDSIVRMAQPFSMRYMLVDGQGNFGSVDGDPPAAMRYTEVRMAKIAHELLADLDKNTVDFVPNYDDKETEPAVLPTRIPNLLINGSSGIAVGMATNIPPHNLGEVVDACLMLLDAPESTISDLMEKLPGPDFPTAGTINGAGGIRQAYETGRGRIYVRANSHVEERSKDKNALVVTELPFQVNKARLLEKIAELVREKRIEGISDLRDESDKDGMRMVIELKRGENTDVVLNNLYKQTMLQTVFGINMVALTEGQPRVMNLKEILAAFIRHRREVVTRRTIFELAKARARAHVLEGLAVALANIDEMIELIKQSATPAEARAALVAKRWEPGLVSELLARAGAEATRPEDVPGEWGLLDGAYQLSAVQAKAILDMQLHRLTGLEQEKIGNEYKGILVSIEDLLDILSSRERLTSVIRDELTVCRNDYADERRTVISHDHSDLTDEDLIPEEDVVVTFSHAGYAKAQPLDAYQAQKRGGRGKSATQVKDEDFIDQLFVANTHDTLLCFTSLGKAYWLKVYQLPQASRNARGKPIVNLLSLDEGERINAVLPVREYEEDKYIFMVTSQGTVKKTPLSAFSRPRTNGIIALGLHDDDHLVSATVTDGDHEIFLFATTGKAIRFHESDVRPMGRTAAGVRGIRMPKGGKVVAQLAVPAAADHESAEAPLILTATEHGYGKRTGISEFSVQGRGGQGVIGMQTTERNGALVGALLVAPDDQIMLITSAGVLVRTPVVDVSVIGRNTQGVRLIKPQDDDLLVGLARLQGLDDEEDEAEDSESDDTDAAPADESSSDEGAGEDA
ncbi:MAG: DNA gyrase subunit A [Gammaproteobacteria bacterium]